ncbi:MAG: gamma-glutamylcyclotransferase family protein, partial [Thermoplasmatota archaeon]
PGRPRAATLGGWRIGFTPHANLLAAPDGQVEGVLYDLPEEQLAKLYGPDGFVTTYGPRDVIVRAAGIEVAARTYIEDAVEAHPDAAYLESFLAICKKVGLSPEAQERIRKEGERASRRG